MSKHSGSSRKSHNPIAGFFRLLVSLTMFCILFLGIYAAYKHFSGVDPLKLSPEAVLGVLSSREESKQLIDKVSSLLSVKLDKNNLLPKSNSEEADLESVGSIEQAPNNSPVTFSVLLVADSHSENNYLKKAITQGLQKESTIKEIIGLGDYTEVGTIEELESAKKVFDEAGVRYFLVPGDHDLWDSRDKGKIPSANFREVFGLSYQTFVERGVQFILINNADNYAGLGEEQIKWVTDTLEKAKNDPEVHTLLVFVHTPLYHPSSDHVMGKVDNNLKQEAKNLIRTFKDYGVKQVFAGDIHFFGSYTEPETGMKMTTLGALATQRNTQAPNYAILRIHEDGSVSVEDVMVD